MTPERYQHLCELFDQAQEHNPAQRAAFLHHACARDPSLRAELEQLLADDQEAWAEKLFQEPCPVNAKDLLAADEPGTAPASPSSDAAGDALIGQHVGPYRIEQRLGSGGMGVVYKAQDIRLGRSVALKFLPAEYAQDRRALERFQREARTASALNHPHICTLHDINTYEGQPFFVMEFIQGRSLRQLSRQRLALDVIGKVGQQVAQALAVAHAAGIVHRDIKPDNIMVRDDGYVKVVDFGLARPLPTSVVQAAAAASEVTAPGTLVGTLRYMSPEQGRAETASSASDIFALGIILYELATGHHPFEADSQLAVLHAILTQNHAQASRPNT